MTLIKKHYDIRHKDLFLLELKANKRKILDKIPTQTVSKF